jgi:hypothetical protein
MTYWPSVLSVFGSLLVILLSILIPDKGTQITTYGTTFLSLILVFLAYQSYSLIKLRMSKEAKPWLFFFIAGILNVALNLTISLRILMGNSSLEFFYAFASGFSFLLYFFIVGGLYQISSIYKSERKVNIKWPVAVVAALFIAGSIFLIFFMKLHQVHFLRQISFLVYLLFDMFLILVSWTVTLRTWGGLFSIPYRFISSGAILFSIYHLTVLVNQITNISYSEEFNISIVIYIITQSLLCIGCDIRVQIEKGMENLAKK